MIYKVYNEKTNMLLEHNIQRVQKLLYSGIPFGMVSAYRTGDKNSYIGWKADDWQKWTTIKSKSQSDPEDITEFIDLDLINSMNEENHQKLKNELKKYNQQGIGFIELEARYGDYEEKSFMVGKIGVDELINIGNRYNQESVLYYGNYKGDKFFGIIPCKVGIRHNVEIMEFNSKPNEALNINSFEYGFSQFTKSHQKYNQYMTMKDNDYSYIEPKENKFSFNVK